MTTKRCPFRKVSAFTDGSWYWVTTDAYGGPGGAYGDDTHDDSDAFEACMAAAISAEKKVYVPPATYLISDYILIASGAHFRGAGPTTKLHLTKDYTIWLANGLSNITLANMDIYGAGTSGVYTGIRTANNSTVSYLTLDGLAIHGFWVSGVHIGTNGSVANLTVKSCNMYDVGLAGLASNDGGASTNWKITDSLFHHVDGRCSENPHGIYLYGVDGVAITDSEFYNVGMKAGGNGGSGTVLKGCTNAVFTRCNAYDNLVVGNDDNGFGFITYAGSDCVYVDCSYSGNHEKYDFYECGISGNGSATYSGSTTTCGFPGHTHADYAAWKAAHVTIYS